MNPQSFLIFLFALFSNVWILRIFKVNLFLGILTTVVTTLFFFLSQKKIKYSKFLVLGFVLILFFVQYKTTDILYPTFLSPQEQVMQKIRFREYPATHIFPLGHWFEDRKESIAFFKIEKNLFENFNLNLYFFGNYPRQRGGIEEFEKFPFLFLPVFIYGFYLLIKQRKFFEVFVFFFLPLLLISFIGNKNSFGPFMLFPFFVLSLWTGFSNLLKKIEKYKHKKLIVIVFLILTFLVLIQIYLYENI